jgi:signal transduction histidine kinase
MKKLFTLSVLSLFCTVSLFASSADDAQKLVNDGAKLCKEKGIDTCLKSFNNQNGPFVKGSLYIFAIDYKGKTLAHGGNPKIKGINLYKVKSGDGVLIMQEFIRIAKEKKEGWLDYRWSHPKTKRMTPKTSFVKAIGNDILIGSGFYK